MGMMGKSAEIDENIDMRAQGDTKTGTVLRRAMLFLAPLALALAVMPALGAIELLYPDLVSDWGDYDEYPSGIDNAEVKPVEEITWNGNNLLVVRFDGFVTNIGDGPLRIAGNPSAGNVHQFLLEAGGDPADPADYQQGPAVTLVYETDDGHNHWHLKDAQEYALWNEAMSQQVTVGSKVGFCLYDIGRVWASAGPQYFSTASVQFCDKNDPGSTAIEMGVTQGWKDVYRSSVSQQWVDVSAIAPGNYRLSSRTDVSNQIVEKNEANNGLSFHPQTVTVPGYRPKSVTASTTTGVAVGIPLQATTFGTPGTKAYMVTSPPVHGTVTVGTSGVATYTPEAGFSGTDSFQFSIHDSTSTYPTVRPTGTATIAVGGGSGGGGGGGGGGGSGGGGSGGTPPPVPAPVPTTPSFDDVAADHPFFAEIAWLAEQNITNGCGTTTFCPDLSMTRGQLASFIVRAFDLPAGPVGSNRFTDDNGSVHEADIEALAAAGVTTGCGADTFCPNTAVTRAEWASFFVRTLFGTAAWSATDPFSDDDGSIHESAIGVLWDQGLTSGCRLGAYCPDSPVTRGQLAAFLHRQLGG
jgi:hypothetical protein